MTLYHPHPGYSPCPLFSPTDLIMGDFVTRDICFSNALMCFPGATLRVILTKLPELLSSLLPSVYQVNVYVGSNVTTHQQSELTKKDFNEL